MQNLLRSEYEKILLLAAVTFRGDYQATYRKMAYEDRSPSALIIHENGNFRRFVISNDFPYFIERSPLSSHQKANFVDTETESFPADFDEVDASDWVNPDSRYGRLGLIYSSSVLLKNGFSYTLLTFDDDCLEEEED